MTTVGHCFSGGVGKGGALEERGVELENCPHGEKEEIKKVPRRQRVKQKGL